MIEIAPKNVVVIEGQGGAGKTTAAQILASRYRLTNFNTGTLFRGTAAALLYGGVAQDEIGDFVQSANYEVDITTPDHPLVSVNGLDISDVLQNPEVTRAASFVGGVKTASEKLERIFNEQLGSRDMVVEGKNLADRIGAQATSMFFFVASRDIRSYRKWKQAHGNGRIDYTLADAIRDTFSNDMRDKGLLKVPENTHIIDTSRMTPIDVVNAISKHAMLG